MKTLRALLPLAVALAAFGALVWYLLGREMGLGRWLLALFLVAHGGVHVFFLVPRPEDAGDDWPFELRAPRPVVLGARGLVGVILLGYLLAALATTGVLVPAEWWPLLVLVPTGASLLLLGLAFTPMLLLGFAIDGALLWLALAC